MIRVLKNHLVAHKTERVGSFVACDALVGEALEDLLEGRLGDAVLLDAELLLFLLKLTKEPSNGLVFLGHAKLKEVTALLEELDRSEIAADKIDDLEAAFQGVEVIEQVSETHLALWVRLSLVDQVTTETSLSDHINDEVLEVLATRLLCVL